MSSRRRPRPHASLKLGGDVLVETETAIVMRLELPAEGPDAHKVTVLVEPDVSPQEVADELEQLAGRLRRGEVAAIQTSSS